MFIIHEKQPVYLRDELKNMPFLDLIIESIEYNVYHNRVC